MSRIGKLPIPVSKGVEINIEGSNVRVKGPKGELVRDFPKGISFTLDDGRVLVARENEEKQVRALHGLSRSLLANMVTGVSDGYTKTLELQVEGTTRLHVRGIDKELVGQVAANIRGVRKPEPYKGKGIRYLGERVRRKAGKAGKAGK